MIIILILAMRKNRPKAIEIKPTFVILGDGECEFWYFQMLKRNERSLQIHIKPELPQKKKLKEQYEKVLEYSSIYSKVFWIVDYDVIVTESRASQKGKKNTIQEFKEYHSNLVKDFKNVIVIINNPCLEFWILLHFEKTGKYYDSCDSAAKQLLKHITDYEKTEKYYTNKSKDIYLKLKSRMHEAINNSKSLGNFDVNSPYTAMSQMHLLFEIKDKNNKGIFKIV